MTDEIKYELSLLLCLWLTIKSSLKMLFEYPASAWALVPIFTSTAFKLLFKRGWCGASVSVLNQRQMKKLYITNDRIPPVSDDDGIFVNNLDKRWLLDAEEFLEIELFEYEQEKPLCGTRNVAMYVFETAKHRLVLSLITQSHYYRGIRK